MQLLRCGTNFSLRNPCLPRDANWRIWLTAQRILPDCKGDTMLQIRLRNVLLRQVRQHTSQNILSACMFCAFPADQWRTLLYCRHPTRHWMQLFLSAMSLHHSVQALLECTCDLPVSPQYGHSRLRLTSPTYMCPTDSRQCQLQAPQCQHHWERMNLALHANCVQQHVRQRVHQLASPIETPAHSAERTLFRAAHTDRGSA